MAVPRGPQQRPSSKKRRATSDGDAKKRPEEQPVPPDAARPADDADADGEAKNQFVLAQRQDAAGDRDSKNRSVLGQGAAAGDRDGKELLEEPVQPQEAGRAAADHEAETQFVLAQEAPAAADRDGKKGSVLPRGAAAAAILAAKNRPELAREAGVEQQPAPEQAAKKSPERVQANDAAPSCFNSSSPDGGSAKEVGAEGAKNRDAPNAAAASSNSGGLATTAGNMRGEQERQEEYLAAACAVENKEYKKPEAEEGKKDGLEIGDGNLKASSVWKFISRPWLQLSSQEEREPNFLRKSTSLLSRLFECCGLIAVEKDMKNLHVCEKRILISQAQYHYNIIEKSVIEKLCNFYSSFRIVLGDGECFYRSFIFAYLELVLDDENTLEENRLLCAIENVSSACMTLHWLYDDFNRYCHAFKELLQRIKKWKTETRADRRMLLLTYFGDYKETEAILSFLRTASAAWILTHPEFAAFHPIDEGTTLEEHCRTQIIQSRSYADNLAIAALADALGVQIQIFSLPSGHIQDMCGSHSCKSTAVPAVSLAYTGVHYDILYPR